MARRLSSMTWADVKEELSIASNRQKLVNTGQDILHIIVHEIDNDSIPDIEGMQFVLRRVIAELKAWENIQRKRQHPKIKNR